MPRQQSYHRQNTPRRSNNTLVNTGYYIAELGTTDGHHQRYIARTQVVHDETQTLRLDRKPQETSATTVNPNSGEESHP